MDLIGVAPRLPAPGETVVGQQFYTAPGGKGANQAVAVARLGARVRMVGRVGSDVFGPELRDDLRSAGVDVEGVVTDPAHPSGIAIILLDDRRQNHIVAIYGANMQCDGDQLRAVESALDGADSLLLQMEVPIEVSLEAAAAAHRIGVTVIWDPAPPAELPPQAYGVIDIVAPNQTEAAFLTGIEVGDVASARAAAEALLSRGVGTAIVKLGDHGAYYASDRASGHVPAFVVDVVDTVAAGDAFIGALAVAMAEGAALKEAVRFACAAGTLAVTKPGAQEAMPRRDEVEALLTAL
jgi:ribokinase